MTTMHVGSFDKLFLQRFSRLTHFVKVPETDDIMSTLLQTITLYTCIHVRFHRDKNDLHDCMSSVQHDTELFQTSITCNSTMLNWLKLNREK